MLLFFLLLLSCLIIISQGYYSYNHIDSLKYLLKNEKKFHNNFNKLNNKEFYLNFKSIKNDNIVLFKENKIINNNNNNNNEIKKLFENDIKNLTIEDQNKVYDYIDSNIIETIKNNLQNNLIDSSLLSTSNLIINFNKFLLSLNEDKLKKFLLSSNIPLKYFKLYKLFFAKQSALILIHNIVNSHEVENSTSNLSLSTPSSSSPTLPLAHFIPFIQSIYSNDFKEKSGFNLNREEVSDVLSLVGEALKNRLKRDKESGFITIEENLKSKEKFSKKYSLFNILDISSSPSTSLSTSLSLNTTEVPEISPSKKLLESSIFKEASLLFFLSEKLLLVETKNYQPSFYEEVLNEFTKSNYNEENSQEIDKNINYFSSNDILFNDFHSQNLFLYLNFYPFEWYSVFLQTLTFDELYKKVQELLENYSLLDNKSNPSQYLYDLWSYYGDQLDQSKEVNKISNRVNGFMMKKIIVDVIKQSVRKDLLFFLPQRELDLLRGVDKDLLIKEKNQNRSTSNDNSSLIYPTLTNYDPYMKSAPYLMLKDVEIEKMIRNVTLSVASEFIERNILEKLYENISANQISSSNSTELLSFIEEARGQIYQTLDKLHLINLEDSSDFSRGEDITNYFQLNIINPLIKRFQNKVETSFDLLEKQRMNKLQLYKGKNSTELSEDISLTENKLIEEQYERLISEVRICEACLQGALSSLNATDFNAHVINLNIISVENPEISINSKNTFIDASIIQNLSTSVKLKLYETFIQSQLKTKPDSSVGSSNKEFLSIISKITNEKNSKIKFKESSTDVDNILISNPSVLFNLNDTDIVSTNREVLHPHLLEFHRSVMLKDLNSTFSSFLPSLVANFSSKTFEEIKDSNSSKKGKKSKSKISESFINDIDMEESKKLCTVLEITPYQWTISSLELFFEHLQLVLQFQNQLYEQNHVSLSSKEVIKPNIFSDLSESSGIKLSSFFIDHLKRVQKYLGLSVQSIFSYAFHRSTSSDTIRSLTKSTLDSFITILDGDLNGDSTVLHQLSIISASNYNSNDDNNYFLPSLNSYNPYSNTKDLIKMIETHPDKISEGEILANLNKIKDYFLDGEDPSDALNSFNLFMDQAFIDISSKHFEKLDQIFTFMSNNTLRVQYEKNLEDLLKTNPQLQHSVIDNLKSYISNFYNTSSIINDASSLSPNALRNLCLHELSVISKLKLIHPNFKDSLIDNSISKFHSEKTFYSEDERKKDLADFIRLSLNQVSSLPVPLEHKQAGSKIIGLFNFTSVSQYSQLTEDLKKEIISDILIKNYGHLLLKYASNIWTAWSKSYINNAEKIFLDDAVSSPIFLKEGEDSFFVDLLNVDEPIKKKTDKKTKSDNKKSSKISTDSLLNGEDLSKLTQEFVNNESIYTTFNQFSSFNIDDFNNDFSYLVELYGLPNDKLGNLKQEIIVKIMKQHLKNLLQDFKHLESSKNSLNNFFQEIDTDSISTSAIRSAAKSFVLKTELSPELIALARLQSESFGLKFYDYDIFQTEYNSTSISTSNIQDDNIPSFETFVQNIPYNSYTIDSKRKISDLLINLLSLELDGCLAKGLREKACQVEQSYCPSIPKKNQLRPSLLSQSIALKGALSSCLAALNGDQSNPMSLPPASRCRMLNQALHYLSILPKKYYTESNSSETSTILDALLQSLSKSYAIYHKNKKIKSNGMKLLKSFKNFAKFAYQNDLQEFRKNFKKDKGSSLPDDENNIQTLAKCDPNCDLAFYTSRNNEEKVETEGKYDYEKSRKTWAWG